MIHVVDDEEFCNDLLQDHDDGDDNKFSLWSDVIVLDTQSTRTRPTTTRHNLFTMTLFVIHSAQFSVLSHQIAA